MKPMQPMQPIVNLAQQPATVRPEGCVSPLRQYSVALAMPHHALGFSAAIRSLVGSVTTLLVTVLLVTVLLTLVVVGRVDAAPIITGLNPTGANATPGNVPADTRDLNWTVARVAASGTYQPGYPQNSVGDPITPPTGGGASPTAGIPYSSYVFQSGFMPPLYLGGAQNYGYCGGLWIGMQNTSLSIVTGTFGPTPQNPSQVNEYSSSAVFSLKFQSNEAGTASFDFWGASDNALAFFVGGTITTSTCVVSGTIDSGFGKIAFDPLITTGSNFPTIFGGTQIQPAAGFYMNGFAKLQHFVGNAPVLAGENTLYAVVYDYGDHTGFLFSPVPEPSSVILASIAGGCILLGSRRRWQRRKAKPDLSDPSGTALS